VGDVDFEFEGRLTWIFYQVLFIVFILLALIGGRLDIALLLLIVLKLTRIRLMIEEHETRLRKVQRRLRELKEQLKSGEEEGWLADA